MRYYVFNVAAIYGEFSKSVTCEVSSQSGFSQKEAFKKASFKTDLLSCSQSSCVFYSTVL